MFYIYIYLIAWLILPPAARARSEQFYVNNTIGTVHHPYAYKEKNFQVVIPMRVNPTRGRVSYAMRHHYDDAPEHASRETDDQVHLMIPIAGRKHHVELRPARHLASPGMLVETFKHARRSRIERPQPRKARQCHFTGRIRGKRISRAALSTCNGLSGYIQTDEGSFMIQPKYTTTDHSEDRPHPHILYPASHPHATSNLFCATGEEEDDEDALGRRRMQKQKRSETITQVLPELTIEALVVLDRSFLHSHKDIEIENYVLTIFNIARDLFHDSTLGVNINLAIVRLIRLEVEDHEMNLAMNHNIKKTMRAFRLWQQRINPKDDTHPNHHDVAVLLTRIDICGDDKTCGFLGAARLGGMCEPENAAVIAQDSGLLAGFTIAHEIGHTLNMIHDPPAKKITMLEPQKQQMNATVMFPGISDKIVQWSSCSRSRLVEFIDYGFGACLFDAPTEHSFSLPNELPGLMYDGDHQCREWFGPNAAICMTGIECHNLICYVEDKGCIETHQRPADGTPCGQDKWCFHGGCVEIGEREDAVHGNWTAWSEWSDCTRTCGSGVAMQKRYCTNPAPRFGGKFCDGDSAKYKICSTEPCEMEQPSFRDVQCAEFDMWEYPGDRKVHQWKSYPIHDENQCALYCVNEEGQVATLRPRVIDGTTCYRGIRDICINGICKEIPCDLDLQSSSVEDRCGVCKGDGTSCDVVRGEAELSCVEKPAPAQAIMMIPAGAVNVKIEEMRPSDTNIQVRNKAGTIIYIDGDIMGQYNLHGTKAWIGMIRTKQEAISIEGPLREAVSVWANVLQNSSVRYTYSMPAQKKRLPVFGWDYLGWSTCSAECGPGVEESVAKCVERSSGLVDESYCKAMPRLKTQMRPCEIAPCIPRWFVGEWSECEGSTRIRLVKCYRPTGNGEGEMDFIADHFCTNQKPKSSESCKIKRSVRAASAEITTARGSSNPMVAPTASTLDTVEIADDDEITFNTTFAVTPTPPNFKSIIDFVSLKHLRLTVHTELEGNQYPKGLPHPKNSNESTYELQGLDALKFMNALQHDFSNNKTKV